MNDTSVASKKEFYETLKWRIRLGLGGGVSLALVDLIARGGWEGLAGAAFATGALVTIVPQYREDLVEKYHWAKETCIDLKTAIPYALGLRSLDIDEDEAQRIADNIVDADPFEDEGTPVLEVACGPMISQTAKDLAIEAIADSILERGTTNQRAIDLDVDEEDMTVPELDEDEVNYVSGEPFVFEEDGGIKTFKQLIESGIVQKMLDEDRKKPLIERRVILGYRGHNLYYVTIKDFYSCGIGGNAGGGKSTTVRFLLFQFALLGFKLIMIDPHISDVEESLAAEFSKYPSFHAIPPCGKDLGEINKRINQLMGEAKRRIEKGIKNGAPLLLVLDEFNGLMLRYTDDQTRKALAELIRLIEEEARKFGMYCWIIGQRWTQNDLGGAKSAGAAIRSSLCSRIAHRFADETQASTFMGSNKAARQNGELRAGHYIFMGASGEWFQVQTPLTVSTDGPFVLSMLPKTQESIVNQRNEVIVESTVIQRVEDVEVLRTMPYRAYLKTPHWQAKRREALTYASYRCQVCNVSGVQLDVHHRTYERRGHEDLSDLTVLCHDCHELYEQKRIAALAIPPEEDIDGAMRNTDFEEVEDPLISMETQRYVVLSAVREMAERIGRMKSKGMSDREIAFHMRRLGKFDLYQQACKCIYKSSAVVNELEMMGNGSTSASGSFENDHLHLPENVFTGDAEHERERDPRVNVNTNGVDERTRKQIRDMRSVRPKPYTHAEISRLVGLDGRKYQIYMQVCKEEGID